jgi:ferritin-like protein
MNRALEATALAVAGAAAGGFVLGELADPATSRPSAKQDAEILNFALLLEYVQAGFYAEGIKRAKLDGDLLTFARTVAAQEQDHLDFLKQALGGAARSAPKLDFGDDTADAERFGAAAIKLEDLGVAAYNAGAPNLTKGTLAAAAKIVSVEARHAAWIRDLRGEIPAPDAAEPATTADQVNERLKGFVV